MHRNMNQNPSTSSSNDNPIYQTKKMTVSALIWISISDSMPRRIIITVCIYNDLEELHVAQAFLKKNPS